MRLAAQEMFRPLAEHGAGEFAPLGGMSIQELTASPELQEVTRHIANPLKLAPRLRSLRELIAEQLEIIYRDLAAAAEGCDAVLCQPATFPALDVAAHLGLPVVHCHLVPAVPTRAFPAPVGYIRARTLTAPGNRLSFEFDPLVTWAVFRRAINLARARVLGRPRRGPRETLRQVHTRRGVLVGISPNVLAPPPDWPADVAMCGFWWLEGDGELGEETERFLAAGPPPLFFGVGSMPLGDPQAIGRAVADAANDVGARVIVQRGWGGLGDGLEGREHVHVLAEAPHALLFGRVAAVAHHGGAGTTGRGLSLGRPTLVLPVLGDQFLWGHRMSALGVGPAPLPLGAVTREALAERFAALLSPAYAERAGRIAAAMAQEDPGGAAVRALERFTLRPA